MRTFIAIEFPPLIVSHIQRLQQMLQTEVDQAQLSRTVKWTQPQNWHITLRFLGSTSLEQKRSVERGLTVLLETYAPLRLNVGGIGCFPTPRQPSVVWTGVHGDLELLQQLQHDIDALVQSHDFKAESKGFTPHNTLAYIERDAAPGDVRKLGALLQQLAQSYAVTKPSASFSLQQITFMQSDLLPTGPIYTRLRRYDMRNSVAVGQ